MLVAIRCALWTKMCGGLDSDDGPICDVPHLKRALFILWRGLAGWEREYLDSKEERRWQSLLSK
jgi:hypothetical protein